MLVRAVLLLIAALALVVPTAAALSGPEHGGVHADTPREVSLDIAAEVRSLASAGGTAASALPTDSCGGGTIDDTANAVFPAALPQFKLVYAYPSDRDNRFNQWRNSLQANVSIISRFVAAQSGARKAPRFDMGTSCGAGYADIAVVALPGARATYVDDFDAVRTAVADALGDQGGLRTPVILADTLTSGGVWGVGALYADDRPGAANPHNSSGFSSVIWVPDGRTAPTSSADGFWPEGFLHEMTHNMGGVQWSAPHNSSPNRNGYFHCWDGLDVMCYADGPDMVHPYETTHCGLLTGAIDSVYDCGGDDYFNPTPAAGTYLATHWNVFDNAYLGDCATLGDACAPAADTPSATVAPSITGAAKVGRALTGSAGTWTGSPVLAVTWQRSLGAGWQDVAGASGTTYVPTADDVGRSLRLRVRATNDTGTVEATSAPVLVVDRVVPTMLSTPTIVGDAREGTTLVGSPGVWSDATGYAYRWLRRAAGGAWSAIPGATGATYGPAASDVGLVLGFEVTATGTDGPATAVSPDSGVVAAEAPAAAPEPAVVVPPIRPRATRPPTSTTTRVDRTATLSLRRGKRTLARVKVRLAGAGAAVAATLQRTTLRTRSGRYTARVCATGCRTVSLRARRGRLTLPRTTVAAADGATVHITLSGRGSATGSVTP